VSSAYIRSELVSWLLLAGVTATMPSQSSSPGTAAKPRIGAPAASFGDAKPPVRINNDRRVEDEKQVEIDTVPSPELLQDEQ
jgi:hypothetical protein